MASKTKDSITPAEVDKVRYDRPQIQVLMPDGDFYTGYTRSSISGDFATVTVTNYHGVVVEFEYPWPTLARIVLNGEFGKY